MGGRVGAQGEAKHMCLHGSTLIVLWTGGCTRRGQAYVSTWFYIDSLLLKQSIDVYLIWVMEK